MVNIEKKGHDIIIKGIVIHQVVKEAYTVNKCNLKLANQPIAPTDKEKLFVARIKDSYYKKSNPTYGIFGGVDPKFQNALLSYIQGNITFFDFSIAAAEQYYQVISRTIAATGGHLVFVHYINSTENQEYMLVMTTNNKDGFFIADDLSIKDVKNLDLNRIDVACLINITKWMNVSNGIDAKSKTYLSFVKGNKDISLYFMYFIDCKDCTTASESTKRLSKAIDAYCKSLNLDRNSIIHKKNDIYHYCTECMDSRNDIRLDAISALFDDEHPNSFMEYAASEDFGVSEIISGDRTQLRKLKYISYKDDNFAISFDSDQLGKTVVYDKHKKQLTFKELPKGLINELER